MKKTPNSQRKSPKQERSKAIVDSIFEATVRILPRIGSENITTKKIAEMAGVGIGSLYQYFPNKESVLSAIMDLAAKTKTEEIQKRIDEIDGLSMEDTTNTMVDLGLEIFLKEKTKTREIFRQAPELGKVPALLKLRQSVVERLALEMEKHHPGMTKAEYVRVSFVAVNSLMGVVHTMLYDESQQYSVEDLSFELKAMLNAYFERRIQISLPK
ncbi:MAG: TetR/AcrR family transcriptional regulator [Proteobacteria bacterium]|nr:MAG: TetR/AcrR family transcriptional regulator [Pseudomonadota bacterium]